MLFYRILPDTLDLQPMSYKGTAAEAHAAAKDLRYSYDEVRIELIDVPSDKASILVLLNGAITVESFKIKQTWKLSPRGAMVECPNGE